MSSKQAKPANLPAPVDAKRYKKRVDSKLNPYSRPRKRGPAFTGQTVVLGAFESCGRHPRTGIYQPVRHYTRAAADKRANDLRRKGWENVRVTDTKNPIHVKGDEPMYDTLAPRVLPDYDDTRMGLREDDEFA